MSDQDNIFQGNAPATQPNNVAPAAANVPPTDSFATLLASVKNERGEPKYRSVEEAFNGLKNAQEYIPTLKNDLVAKEQALQAAQAEIARLKAVEETVLALTSNQNNSAPPAQAAFDPKQIAELVSSQINQHQTETVQRANVASVVSTLQSVFGADAEKTFYGKAEEFGMSMQEMNTLAAKSPKAVLKMLGIEGGAQKQNVAPVQGTINTGAYQPKQDTFVGRNTKSAMIGATTEDLRAENHNARAMVEELHAAGLTVHDLSDPKVYKRYFK